MPEIDELVALVRLNLVRGVGARTLQRLVNEFGSAQDALSASPVQLRRVQGVCEEAAEYIAGDDDEALREIERAEAAGARIISLTDREYPVNLKSIYDPPVVLYVRGELRPEDSFAVGIVGARSATPYGKKQSLRLAGGLALAGCCVVSGLARGIDAHAHHGCLDAGGRTIAVLACGVDRTYPPENRDLAEEIAESGAVISEFPMGIPPKRGHFPRRNRVISGLSLAVVIVEAGARSGALITAKWAAEQNRDVMAVPGSIESPASVGCHRLIRDGAKLVTCPGDILEELRPHTGAAGTGLPDAPPREEKPIIPPSLSDDERAIFDVLSTEPRHIDEIAAEAGRPVAAVSGTLMMLEIKKLAVQLPGKMFIRD